MFVSFSLIFKTIFPFFYCSLCTLVRWGAMDAEANPEDSMKVIQVSWKIGIFNHSRSSHQWLKARVSALRSLNCFEASVISAFLHLFSFYVLLPCKNIRLLFLCTINIFLLKIEHILKAIPDFLKRSLEFLVSEDNPEIQKAMEELVVRIINFEHM